ncbi:MAG TPA: HAD family phosphatase [Anaerolineales bacterium]|nr:HAD family phosphatase [Anaerolineales bacterium]
MSFPKAVLWDMDGVLADTSPLHFATWAQILNQEGIHFDRQKFHQIYGLKNRDLLPYLTGKPMETQWAERIAAQKELAFRQILPGKLFPLPGVVDWLKRFRVRGCKQAVASSAPSENVEALVDELQIRQYFDALVTPGDLPGKPDPAVFLLAARQLKAESKNCLVIEDSIPGVQAAKFGGMRCLAVTTTNPPEALTQADLVIETMAQLTEQQVDSLF